MTSRLAAILTGSAITSSVIILLTIVSACAANQSQPDPHVAIGTAGIGPSAVTGVIMTATADGTANMPGPGQPPNAGAVPRAVVPPSAPPTLVGPVILTVADADATVLLHQGQSITVSLAADGQFSWYLPVANDPALRLVSASGGYPSTVPAQAMFRAEQPGRVMLTTTDDTPCFHAHPSCTPPVRPWRVTVVIS